MNLTFSKTLCMLETVLGNLVKGQDLL